MDGLGRSFKVLMALKIKSKVNVEQKKEEERLQTRTNTRRVKPILTELIVSILIVSSILEYDTLDLMISTCFDTHMRTQSSISITLK